MLINYVFFLLMYRPRWVVPVLPKGELEVLLEAAIDLCKKGNALFLGLVYHFIFLLFSLIVLLSSSRSSITFICIILSFHFCSGRNSSTCVNVSLFLSFLSPGLDVKCEACQRFFRDGLTISFTKILTDEAVSGWKFEIHVSPATCFMVPFL